MISWLMGEEESERLKRIAGAHWVRQMMDRDPRLPEGWEAQSASRPAVHVTETWTCGR